jgi:hypothetical protein
LHRRVSPRRQPLDDCYDEVGAVAGDDPKTVANLIGHAAIDGFEHDVARVFLSAGAMQR